MKKSLDTIKNTRIGKLVINNQFILLSFFSSVLLSLLIAFCYELVPFGDKTILRMDLYHQYGPLFAELYERLTHGDGLIYSWISGGGSSFLGNFYNYLSSPLSLCVLLFGHENITEAISFMIFCKACLSSATFTYYLKASLNKSSYITAGFGVLYAFSGYFIAYYWNLMWLDAMVLLPIILYGIERIINKGKPATYMIALGITMFSNYYMSYMTCMFSVIYFLFYYFSRYSCNAQLNDIRMPLNKDKLFNSGKLYKIRASRFLNSGVIFGISSLLTAGIVAFALIPTYFILQSCSATSGTFPEEFELYNNVFDFLANHLASVEPTIRSSGDDVLPNVYCGILTVITVPLFYFTKSISFKEKTAYTALLAVLFMSFNTNYFNYIWHGFHFPNDLPYRFSFMYSFIILVMSFKTVDRIREFKPKEIMGAGLGVAIFIVLIEKIGSKNVDASTVLISLGFAIIYTVVLYTLSSKKYNKQAVCLFVLCAIISEYAIASTDSYVMNQTKTSYASDLADFEEVKEQVDALHGNDNYRMELTDLRTRMDPCWYYYNGISTFSSMAYEKVSNLQQNLGMFGNYINSYTYNLQTPVYNAMFGIDYIFNNSGRVMSDNLYEMVAGNSEFTAYKNKYPLPIAYVTEKGISAWDYTNTNPFEMQNEYFELATGIQDVFVHEDLFDLSGFNVEGLENYDDLKYFYFNVIDSSSQGEVIALSLPEETRNYYLYVKASSIDSVSVNVANTDLEQNMGDEYYILDLGVCPEGEIITITMPIKEGTESDGVDFLLYSLDIEKFKAGYNKLKDNSLNITEFDDTEISGTVNSDIGGILYTSIPYDKGWTVMIDGKEASDSDIIKIGDALLSVKISKGQHDISFRYTPKGFTVGIIISVVSLLITLLYFLYVRKQKYYKLYDVMFDTENQKELYESIKHKIDIENNILKETEEITVIKPDTAVIENEIDIE